MSLFGGQRRVATVYGPDAAGMLAERTADRRSGAVTVTNETAMRHSAVWACLRLRADLVSTMPTDVYRRVLGVQVEVPPPPVLVAPGGERVGIQEWLYSTQVDLDRAGNTFGIITERNALGLPARIDLVCLSEVSVRATGAQITKYRIGARGYDPDQIWHEKQFTIAGMPLGLSPVAFAAWSVTESLSAQRFALDWFGGSAVPMAELKNTAKTINKRDAEVARDFYNAAVKSGDLFIHGNDWEYKPIQTVAAQTEFLEARRFGLGDIARFFGCPGDLIDAAVSTGSITYASMTQRNLQFLIMNLDPAITRRETALSALTPKPRYVKLNRAKLLAMDPEARARTIKTRIDSRTLAPSEAREIDDLPPLTDEQIAEFDRLFGAPRTQPTGAKA